jgi:hypothetical protein
VLCPLVKHNVQASIGGIKEVGCVFHCLVKAAYVYAIQLGKCRTHLSEWVAEML